jgi:hypothetical protein
VRVQGVVHCQHMRGLKLCGALEVCACMRYSRLYSPKLVGCCPVRCVYLLLMLPAGTVA